MNDRLSRPRWLGEGLRLINSRPRRFGVELWTIGSRAGRLLGLRDRDGDRDDENDRDRLRRRLSLRVGDLERLGESEYLRLLGAGERDLVLLSESEKLSGEDVLCLLRLPRLWGFLFRPDDRSRFLYRGGDRFTARCRGGLFDIRLSRRVRLLVSLGDRERERLRESTDIDRVGERPRRTSSRPPRRPSGT